MPDILIMNMSKVYRFDTYKYVNPLQKEINYFLAVVESLNVSKAAENLGIQQSGLSRAIQRLEQDLGQKLFQRKNIGLSLTPQGDRFYKVVKDTKQRWEENFNQLLNDSDSPSGLVKVGLHSSFGQLYLPKIIKNLCSQFPQIEIEVNMLHSFETTRKVLENEIDFGVVISEIKSPEVVQKNIGIDFLAAYQLDLKKMPTHFLINPDTQASQKLLKKYSQLRKIYIKDYELLAKTTLFSDFTVGLLPHSVALNYQNLRQASGALSKAQISLICHKEKLKSKSMKKIYDVILMACRSNYNI